MCWHRAACFLQSPKAAERPDGHLRAPKKSKNLNEQLDTSHTLDTACRASSSRSSFCAVPVLSPPLSQTAQLEGNCGLRLTGDATAMAKKQHKVFCFRKM